MGNWENQICVRATTIRKYRDLADRIVIPELGKVKLKALTARQLDRLYAKLTVKGNKATSVRRVPALIAAALHQAERWDMVDHSVARKANPPRIRQEPVKAPTPDEVRAIVAKAEELEPGLATLLLTGALNGAQRGELCALRCRKGWFPVGCHSSWYGVLTSTARGSL